MSLHLVMQALEVSASTNSFKLSSNFRRSLEKQFSLPLLLDPPSGVYLPATLPPFS